MSFWISHLDELEILGPTSFIELRLSEYGRFQGVVDLVVDEEMNSVLLGETLGEVVFVPKPAWRLLVTPM